MVLPPAAPTAHANKHAEADEIRACYDLGGTFQRWVALDPASGLQRDHCLVMLADGRVGDRIVQWCRKMGWIEVTAFVIGGGSLEEAIAYLQQRGCERVDQ